MRLTINFDKPRGWIKAEPNWTYSTLELCKAAPGKTRFVNPIFWFERSKENDDYFKEQFPNANFTNSEQRKTDDAFLAIERPKFRFLTEPDKAQLEALSRAQKQINRFAFFEKPGFGKTKVILDHVVRLFCDNMIDCLFIIAPNIVHEQWILDEIPKHVHPSIPLRKYIYRSSKKLDKAILESDGGVFRIMAMNIESTVSQSGESFWKQFAESGRCAVIVDESHRIKQHSGKVSSLLFKERKLFFARFIATGSPDPLGLHDYYAQMRFVDPGIINVKSFAGFKSKYCLMGGFEGKEIRGYTNTSELHQRMAPFVHVGEPLIKGEQIFEVSRFDLPPNARSIYEELKNTYLVMFEDGRMASVQNQLTAILRLQQIACGRLVLEDGTVRPVHNERLQLLKSLIGRFEDEKIVIWNRFVADMEQQMELLGDKAVGVWGVHKDEERRRAISAFLDPKSKIKYFITTPAATGTGLNLQGACRTNIYFSNSDNYGQRIQSEYRTYRRGVEGNVLYIDIAARKSVDNAILSRSRNKHQSALMSYSEFKELLTQ
jgi:hypothetical protein